MLLTEEAPVQQATLPSLSSLVIQAFHFQHFVIVTVARHVVHVDVDDDDSRIFVSLAEGWAMVN